MKILFFVRHYFNISGGIEENVFNISRFLKNKNKIAITVEEIDGHHNKFDSEIEYVKYSDVKISDYDIIFIENFEIMPHFFLCIKIILLKTFTNKVPKVILVPHGGFTLNWALFNPTRRIIKFLYNKSFGLFFINHYCDLVIAVSDWEKGALKNEGIVRNIVVIRNGFDGDFVRLIGQYKKEPLFIFLGRIQPIKNIEEIISTSKFLFSKEKFKHYKLEIIGDYTANQDYYSNLRKLIEEDGLTHRIQFLGPKYGSEKYALLAKAECLFCLSHWENDPVVIKEAFSVNTKVLSNQKFGLSDLTEEKNVFMKEGSEIDADEFYLFLKRKFDLNFTTPILTWEKVASQYAQLVDWR